MTAMRRESAYPPYEPEAEWESYGIIGCSHRIRKICETIRATASSDASVLIEGESGTGKEVIARAFHDHGSRAGRPFISINCAAIPGELIELELFGCRRGAFTGAASDRSGLIEAVSGGTLFLDEIGEMPPALQTKLLRVLQERKLRRLGEVVEIEVDFRLICATNRDVAESIRTGALRDDLFYRISTIRIKVPPLRERLDDLCALAFHFVQQFSRKYDKRVEGIADDAIEMMTGYSWPGNVRELENVIERAVLFCRGTRLIPENLPEDLLDVDADEQHPWEPEPVRIEMTMREIERRAIERTLRRTGGNIKRASEILDVHRQTLYRKLKSYNLLPSTHRRTDRCSDKGPTTYSHLEM